MAVNNICSDYQKSPRQPGNGNGYDQEAHGLQRTRTASPENGRASPNVFNPYYTGTPRTPSSSSKSSTVDRQEIIRRIKSGGSRPTSPELEKFSAADRQGLIRRIKNGETRPKSPDWERASSDDYNRKQLSPTLHPSTSVLPSTGPAFPEAQHDNQSIGLQIERPRSALHRGDFRDRVPLEPSFGRFGTPAQKSPASPLSTSPVVPWHSEFPSAAYRQTRESSGPSFIQNGIPIPQRPARGRTASNASLAANFAYKPPTSPLVQSSRPDTPEPLPPHFRSRSPDKLRRRTFSPQSSNTFQSALDHVNSRQGSDRTELPLHSEKSFPYQAHQPRRSLNAASFSSLPHTPNSASRRPSFSTESPLHHAPMVGSYEESILRGRMSTIPSRPLNFMAQIGVLGKGDCKSNLRCPPHVSVPFPAVFYSYGSGTKNSVNDQPSPYVGLVDLENNLSSQEDLHERRRNRLQGSLGSDGSCTTSPRSMREDEITLDSQTKRRKRQKAKRRSTSPRAPPGGSYRIPQQGQLQIVIKNPNKTAVKLFLVPYDVSDMEPGQKTFLRQRSYSAGPIIDMPLSSRKNLGTDRPEAALNATGDPHDKPMLRYLIHLHICCPSKGRYFLYKSIRVVFANRVPDGKEKLRNEIQLPEPKYSAYKVGKDSHVASTGTFLPKEARRRSGLESPQSNDSQWPQTPQNLAQSLPWHEYCSQYDFAIPSLPRNFTTLPTVESRPSSRHLSDDMDVSVSLGTPSIRSPLSSEGDTPQKPAAQFEDPFGFELDRSRELRTSGRSESLLSKRLMDLAFQKQGLQEARNREA